MRIMKWNKIIFLLSVLIFINASAQIRYMGLENTLVRIATKSQTISIEVRNYCGNQNVVTLTGMAYRTVGVEGKIDSYKVLEVGKLCPNIRSASLSGYIVCKKQGKPSFVSFDTHSQDWTNCVSGNGVRYKSLKFFTLIRKGGIRGIDN